MIPPRHPLALVHGLRARALLPRVLLAAPLA
jgi:hypothetical protein